MRSRLSVLFLLFLFALGCSKSNSSTGPDIKMKSYTNAVPPSGTFSAVLSFSQKNGNISYDSLQIFRRRYNQSYIPDDEKRDFFGTRLPITPSASQAEFNPTLAWRDIQYGINGENDTCDFRFVLIDQNGNHSDTASTGIVIIYQ